MSRERAGRSEEIRKRARDIVRVVALSAGIIAGATDEERARHLATESQEIQNDPGSVFKPYPGWRRSNNVEDRRLDITSGPVLSYSKNPDVKIPSADSELSGLAVEAGANHIGKSPADIMRERLFNQGKEMLKKEIERKNAEKRKPMS